MSRYNTGNPIDSGALKDLSDNAKNLDVAMNKTGAWRDRFNVSRLSLIDAISRASSGAPLFATLDEGMAATEIGGYFSVYEQNGDTEIRKKTTAYASILIKSDADLKLDIGFIATRSTVDTENIKSSATVIQGYRLKGGVSPSITANSSYAVMTVPVTKGGYYAVNFGRILPTQDFIVATSSGVDFSESTKKTLNVIQKSTLSIVYVPPKLGLEYIVFNVKSPSLDIENSVVVQEYPDEFIEVYKIDGHALHSDIDTSAFVKSSTDLVNVFDNNNDVLTGRYIHTSGEMRVLADVEVAAVEVAGGETLAFDFYDAGVSELDHLICYFNKTEDELRGSTSSITPDARLTVTIAYDKFGEKLRLVSVPSGLSGYVLTNVNIQPFDIRTKLQVFKILQSDLEVRPTYSLAKNAETYGNLTNKKWVAIGDSITEVNFRSRKNYHKFIQQKSSGLQIENRGRSGTGFYNRFNVADDVTTVDPDIITVFLGTNDYGNIGNNNLPLGVISDATNATISGRVTILLEGLIDKFYNARIALITPIPRLDSYGSDSVVNEQGYNLKMLSDLLVEKCAGLGIPVLNLYEQSSLPVFNPSGNDYFFTAPKLTVADGLHPNDDGHRVLSTKIGNFLCSI